MADTKVSALTRNTTPLGGDLMYQVDDPGGTPAPRYMIIGDVSLAAGPPQGGLINGYVSRTVASNNLTIAIKTLAGADPSATDPVYCRIGNTVRTITAALSVTKNAGTNWCNSGGAELATNEVDYFVYLGYNATDGIVIGFSRIPSGRVYGDFSSTSTNEKYCGISTITHAAASDEYENIGRVNVILSAGAGYTWSVPATSIILSRPSLETRQLLWTPQHGGFSANPTVSGLYKLTGNLLYIVYAVSGVGTSSATTYTITRTPFVPGGQTALTLSTTYDNGAYVAAGEAVIDTAGLITLYKSARASWTNSGNKFANIVGSFLI